MKTMDEQLPPELAWQADGHVTEEVILAVADGQEAIVPPPAFAHIAECDRCSQHLGEAALRSLQVSEDLVLIAPLAAAESSAALVAAAEPGPPAPEVTRALTASRRPMPWKVIAPALAVAALSAMPAALELARGWSEMIEMATSGLFIILRSAVMLARSGAGTSGTTVALLSGVAAVLLVLAGIWIARSSSQKVALEGGVS
jgi:hypothetical protein